MLRTLHHHSGDHRESGSPFLYRDIIDTTPADGDVWKMLLGAIDPTYDSIGENGVAREQDEFIAGAMAESPEEGPAYHEEDFRTPIASPTRQMMRTLDRTPHGEG